MSGFRILVVGCGELGSRHLQAVATLPEVSEIDVVDPRPEGLDLGRQRLGEISNSLSWTKLRWLVSLKDASKGGDLCIIATHAIGRDRLVKDVVGTLGYRSFLLEKMVAQSVAEYEGLLEFANKEQLRIWVNCKARAYSIHRHIKTMLDPSEPMLLSEIGGNHGLATNGVHVADLFTFYDEADYIQGGGSCIDPILHPSKRGNGVYDLSGILHGYSSKGSRMIISYARDHTAPDHISISSSRYRAIVDHLGSWAWEGSPATGWQWRPIPFEDEILVSHMTKGFAADILSRGDCDLPTLKECFPAHRFILSELRPHFNRLLGRDSAGCPVT